MKANKWQGNKDDDLLAADERVQAKVKAEEEKKEEEVQPSDAEREEKAVKFGAVATPKGAMKSMWTKVKLAVKTVKTVKEAGIASVKAVLVKAADTDLSGTAMVEVHMAF